MDLSTPPDEASVQSFLDFVRKNSPYYAQIWEHVPRDAPLSSYPAIDLNHYWEAARKDQGDLVLTGPHESGLVIKSGGTTDKPKVVRVTYEENDASNELLAGYMRMVGIGPGDRIANLFYAGNMYYSFLGIHDAMRTFRQAVNLPISGNMAIDGIGELLFQQQPTVIFTLLSVATKLATEITKNGRVPLECVRLILYGGEALYEDQIAPIAQAFPRAQLHCLAYGAMDGGTLGFQLGKFAGHDDGVYSVNWPQSVVEIVDEENRPLTTPGAVGTILATNLVNRLMPFVRYPVGDRGTWVDHSRGLFRLLGRDDKIGVRLSGNTTTYQDIRSAVTLALRCGEPGRQLDGLQVVTERHEARDRMRLRIVGCFGVSEEVAAASIHDSLTQLNPGFGMHVVKDIIGPLVVEFCAMSDLKYSPLSGKVIEVLDVRQPEK